MIKIYEFTADGLALGSTIVVSAKRKDTAIRIAKQWAKDNCIDSSTVGLVEVKDFELSSVVYAWNGDY